MSPETVAGPAQAAQAKPLYPFPPLPAHWRSLASAFVHSARENGGRPAISDSTGASLSFSETLLRALVLGRCLARTLGPAKYVGLLIPPTVPAAVANVALTLWGKVPVNLNYTAGQDLIDSSIAQCEITHVLTSAKVLDKFKVTPKATLVFLEDIPKQIRLADKLWAAAVAKLAPTGIMGAFLPGLRNESLDDTATIIFTSGSTGDPKGVVLSQRNILSNIHQLNNHLQLLPDESVLGILPFFHSFGFTVTIWTPLCLGKRVVFHINPLDAKIICNLCEKHKVTLLAASPTFMRAYLHRFEPKQFATLVHLVLGAEKLKPELAREMREKLGFDPQEGYGCTELSPVVSVNLPYDKKLPDGRIVKGNRMGTVGLPVPGTAIRIIDPETGAELPQGVEGTILISGPQVMVGYLNRPEATAKVLKDGWYNTGDLGYVDPDGFLKVTDRLSRFSKIAGEMVPHMAVESAIQEATGTDDQVIAITSVPDPKRGERLCVVHTPALEMAPDEVVRRLNAGSMPRLWIPSAEDFVEVEAIPILGTGKMDLRRLKAYAQEKLVK